MSFFIFMHFKTTLQLAQYWKFAFYENIQIDNVRLVCQDSLSFELICLSVDTSRLTSYARDALHYALVAHYRDQAFWEFLFNDTYNLQSLFMLDQVDIVSTILLLLEDINAYGFNFPSICYDLSAARCSIGVMTPQTEHFLSTANFEKYDFDLAPLLLPSAALELYIAPDTLHTPDPDCPDP